MYRFSLVFFFCLCAAGQAAAGWADSLFDERARDFGSVPRGPTLSHAFRLTNTTAAPVQLGAVRVSCGCVSAAALKTVLQPGESTAVLAQMDTSRFYGFKTVTVYVQFLSPQFDDVHLTVQANSRDDVTIAPEALAFGQIKRGKPVTAGATITFLGTSDTQVLELRSETNYVQPSIREVKRDGGEVAYQLTARLRPDVPVGKWYTDLWLKTTNPAAPQVRVPLTVEVEPALSVSPLPAALGEIRAGTTAERKVIVRGEAPFRITAIKGGDAQLSVTDLTKDSKSLHVLLLSFKAAQAGDLRWRLKVETDLPDEGEVEFPALARVVP